MNNLTVSPTAAQASSPSTRLAESPFVQYNKNQAVVVWVRAVYLASSNCSSENIADLRETKWTPFDLTKTSPRTAKKVTTIQNECAKPTIDLKEVNELARRILSSDNSTSSFSPPKT